MRRNFPIWMTIWVALFASTATAEPIVVFSGEHQGYSRVVMNVPENSNYQAQHVLGQVKVTFNQHRGGFDHKRVFNRISRARIDDVTNTPSSVTFHLACDCKVSLFKVDANHIALDVADDGIQLKTTLLPLKVESKNRPIVEKSQPTPPPSSDDDSRSKPASAITDQVIARKPLNETEQILLENMQKKLALELGSAATRGILQLSPNLKFKNMPKRPQIDVSELQAQGPAHILDTNIRPFRENFRVTTSSDLEPSQKDVTSAQSINGFVCPTDQAVDIENWANQSNFQQTIGKLRPSLFSEFDRLDTEAAVQLAKAYLHFGFGAEARRILEMEQQLAKKNEILLGFADILENDHAAWSTQLKALTDCDGDIALWAILAHKKLASDSPVNRKAVLLALNKLPLHLRKFLAPSLSRKLLEYGDPENAASALRSLERTSDGLTPSGKLAQAHIDLQNGEITSGQAHLEAVAEMNEEVSPKALVALVESQLDSDQPLSHETAGLVAAYAKELHHTKLGPQLRRAHVLALVKSGQFDSAYSELIQLDGLVDTEAAVELRLTMLRELTKSASDIIFLEYAFAQQTSDIEKLSPSDSTAFSARLLELGFAELAHLVIDTTRTNSPSSERQLLASRIALALDQPQLAIAELFDINSDAAARLRADAHKRAGQHNQAHDLYKTANQDEQAARAAWLSDDWQKLTTPDVPVFGTALSIANVQMPNDESLKGMLERSEYTLTESKSARDAIERVLGAEELQLHQ